MKSARGCHELSCRSRRPSRGRGRAHGEACGVGGTTMGTAARRAKVAHRHPRSGEHLPHRPLRTGGWTASCSRVGRPAGLCIDARGRCPIGTKTRSIARKRRGDGRHLKLQGSGTTAFASAFSPPLGPLRASYAMSLSSQTPSALVEFSSSSEMRVCGGGRLNGGAMRSMGDHPPTLMAVFVPRSWVVATR